MEAEKNVEEIAVKRGFRVVRKEEIKEIDGVAWVLKHAVSGADLLYLQNEDENKSFSIAFKTPPKDSTGVFHILEHSVLCGSKKYLVKEPFVNLLKSSMQTFLNAMTFPDKTVYPIASTNEQDLLNLMNVYLDAVFYPRIYGAEEIFLQEGWHKETGDEGNLVYSGVVYNEMQGALSDPDSVLFDALCERLYPDSAYSFESGGDPKVIPDLTYEEFLKTHAKHYVPSNSKICLYGDLDIDKFLSVISNDYLLPVQNEILNNKRAIGDPHKTNLLKPVNDEVLVKEMDIDSSLSTQAIAFRLCDAQDIVTTQAFNLFMDAVMSSNVSPLKAKLLETGVADEFYYSVIEPVEKPALMIACQGINDASALVTLEKVTLDFFRNWPTCENDIKLIEASIDHAELVMKEHNFGTADGVVYALDALSTWLYSDDCVFEALKFEKIFESLRSMLYSRGFEELINLHILKANGIARAKVVVKSESFEGEAEHQLTKDEQEKINSELEILQEKQNEPDSQECLAKLPYLKKAEVKDKMKKHTFEAVQREDETILFHKNLNTSDLVYFNNYFDCRHMSEQDFFYLALLAHLLGKFDTDDFTAEEIDLKSTELFGKCRFGISVPNNLRDVRLRFFTVSASCLQNKIGDAAHLLGSILSSTNFDNDERLAQILQMIRIDMQQSIINSGHTFARKAADSTLTWQGFARNEISGIAFYEELCRVCDNLEEKLPEVKKKCKELLERIAEDHSYHSTSATQEDVGNWLTSLKSGFNKVTGTCECEQQMPASSWIPNFCTEAYAVKSDVTFTAVRSNFDCLNKKREYDGAWAIASRMLTYEHLWNTIRVQGGAYGCGFSVNQFGAGGFYTYRDPKIASSIETIKGAGKWLENFNPTQREFEGFVVSTVSEFDKPAKPSALIARGDAQFFSKTTEEEREKFREQVLSATPEGVRSLGKTISQMAEKSSICVVGDKDSICEWGKAERVTEL